MLACICELVPDLAEPWCVTVNDAAGCRSAPSWPNGTRGGEEEEGCAVPYTAQVQWTVYKCTLWQRPYKQRASVRPAVADM